VNAIRHIPKITVNVVTLLLRFARLVIIIAIFYVVYKILLSEAINGSRQVIPIFGLWLLSSYIVIPRIHRIMTKYYLPNYFVGRIRSPDGLLSDPVNLALYGTEPEIHSAMQKANWDKAEDLTTKTFIKTAYCSIFHRSYPNAPVGGMYLFNRKQDFAYQQEVGGSPNTRHHIRFWKTPKHWYMPGGRKADWLAAATYDTRLGIKMTSGQIDHRIHEDIDEEREYVIDTLKKTGSIKNIEVVKHFTASYHDRNSGGDMIKTDGSLPFITL